MYEGFYNLQAEPFRLSPDHRFCFEHKGYARARAYMAYAFMRAEGFVMITGRPGTGKTTLIGELIDSLAGDNVSTANLVCTQLQADDLLKTVAYSFGVKADGADKAELLQHLNLRLHRWHRDGRRALLIVDEAQDLSLSAMEELRLLTNIQVDGQPLLQIFLLGQPELRDLVLSPEMEQVHQRIVAACHLQGLEADEVEAYVLHRLGKVGWRGDPAIERAVFPLLHKFSEGVPRRINLICSRLLLHCGVEQRHTITLEDMRVVIGELQGENLAAGTRMVADDFVQKAAESDWAGGFVERAAAEGHQDTSAGPAVQDAPPSSVRLRSVGGQPPDVVADDGVEWDGADSERKKKTQAPVIPAPPPASTAVSDPPESGQTAESVHIERDMQSSTAGAAEEKASHVEQRPPHRESSADSPSRGESAAAFTARNLSGAERRLRPTVRPAATARSAPVKKARAAATGRRSTMLAVLGCIVLVAVIVWFIALGWIPRGAQTRAVSLEVPPVAELPEAPLTPAPGSSDSAAVVTGSTAGSSQLPVVTGEPGDGLAPGSEFAERAESEPAADPPASGVPGSFPPAADEPPAGISEAQDTLPVETVPEPSASNPASSRDLTLLVGFGLNSAELDNEARFVLDETARLLERRPRMNAVIAGFADGPVETDFDTELSRRRASAVENYLMAVGIGPERLAVETPEVMPEGKQAAVESQVTLDKEKYRIVKIRLSAGGTT